MVATTSKTRKAKDHNFKVALAADMVRTLGIDSGDIVIPPSSFPGIDIILSPEALKKFPFGIEAKRQEALAIPTWWRQCTRNAGEANLPPLLVFRRNHEEPLALLRWEDLLALLSEVQKLHEATLDLAVACGRASSDPQRSYLAGVVTGPADLPANLPEGSDGGGP